MEKNSFLNSTACKVQKLKPLQKPKHVFNTHRCYAYVKWNSIKTMISCTGKMSYLLNRNKNNIPNEYLIARLKLVL